MWSLDKRCERGWDQELLEESWRRREARVAQALSGSISGSPDGTSLLAQLIMRFEDFPAGRRDLQATVYRDCYALPGDDCKSVIGGVRFHWDDDDPLSRVEFPICELDVRDDEIVARPLDGESSEHAATVAGELVSRVRWAQLHGVQLSFDTTQIASYDAQLGGALTCGRI